MSLLTNSRVLVVGAAGAVGEGVVRALLGHGASVVGISRSETRLRELGARLDGVGPGTLTAQVLDISDPDSAAVSKAVLEAYGSLDGVVISISDVGTAGRRTILETSNETWDAMILANQTSQFRAFRALIPTLSRTGALVNLAGLSGEIPFPGMALIAATNAANKSLAVTLAAELGDLGPRIYQLMLGVINTRYRRGGRIDPSWYSAEDIGEHAAHLIAGDTPFAGQVLQYLVDSRTGVTTTRPNQRDDGS